MSLYDKLNSILEANDGYDPDYHMPPKWTLPKAKRGGYKVGLGSVPRVMDDYNGWGRNFERSKSDSGTARLMKDYKGPTYKDPDNETTRVGDHEKKYLSSKLTQDNRRNIRVVK